MLISKAIQRTMLLRMVLAINPCIALATATVDLEAFHLISGQSVNMTSLVSSYILTCGSSSRLCQPLKAPFLVNLNCPGKANCDVIPEPGCGTLTTCDTKCATDNTCAPDAENAFLNVSCISTDIYSVQQEVPLHKYNMIASCQYGRSHEDKRCDLPSITTSNMFSDTYRPVISRVSYLVYRNRYCAACNNDTDIIPFDIEASCKDGFDINSFATLEEVWSSVKLFNCAVSYIAPEEFRNIIYECDVDDSLISKCNVTGLWFDYDPEIEWACENFNSNALMNYRNIFCYICNPSLVSTSETEIIDTCNITGNYKYSNIEAENACRSLPAIQRTFPFRNAFCKLCNGINTDATNRAMENNEFSLYAYDINDGGAKAGGSFTSFMLFWKTLQDTISRDITYQNHVAIQQINLHIVLEELGRFCGYEKFCNTPYKNLDIPYTCPICQFPCAEGTNCCNILSLGLRTDTLIPANFSFISDHMMFVHNILIDRSSVSDIDYRKMQEYYPVIGHCLQTNGSSAYFDKCETTNSSDILAFIPVTSYKTRADYKSVYCARCNGESGTLHSTQFSIHCDKPFEGTSALQFSHVLQIASGRHCQIKVKPHIGLSYCTNNSGCVQDCSREARFMNFSTQVVNMCEDETLSLSMFPPVRVNQTLYKNIFCRICNHFEGFDREIRIISECNETGMWDLYEQNNIEDLCHNTSLHPSWFPYKNIFCAICNTAQENVHLNFRPNSAIGQCVGILCYVAHSSYRTVFSVPAPQHFDENLYMDAETSSTVFCAKGRMMKDGVCQIIIETTVDLRYELTFKIRLVYSSVKTTMGTVLEAFGQQAVYQILNQHPALRYDVMEITSLSFNTNENCNDPITVADMNSGNPMSSPVPSVTAPDNNSVHSVTTAHINSGHVISSTVPSVTTAHINSGHVASSPIPSVTTAYINSGHVASTPAPSATPKGKKTEHTTVPAINSAQTTGTTLSSSTPPFIGAVHTADMNSSYDTSPSIHQVSTRNTTLSHSTSRALYTTYINSNYGMSPPDQQAQESFPYIITANLHVHRTKKRTALEEALINSRNMSYYIYVKDDLVILHSSPYDVSPECKSSVGRNKCGIPMPENENNVTDGIPMLKVNKMLSCVLQILENYSETLTEKMCSRGIPFERLSDDISLRLCANHIKELSYRPENKTVGTMQLMYGAFSFVCTFFSLLFLLVTFCIYMVFKTMRTIPGLNNVNLVFNLFWAQALLQFGLRQTNNRALCVLLGIVTHYFWLGAFCAMNICSFHMFRVFTSTLYSSRQHSKWIFIKYCIYIYVTPAIAIFIYVLFKVLTDGSQNLGYGGPVCFLSESLPIVIMFITPACVIILLNAIFFGLAYMRIRSSPHIQSNVERNDFKIYVKLLTVTGIAWPLLFIDALLPLSLFSFFANFANALQGVFIFVAFICNKNVKDLCKVSCCKNKYVATSVELLQQPSTTETT